MAHRVEAIGHYGLSLVASPPCTLFEALEQPLAYLSLCGGWSRCLGLGYLLGGIRLQERAEVTPSLLKIALRDKVLDLRPFPVYMLQYPGRGIPGKPKNIPSDLKPPPWRNIFQCVRGKSIRKQEIDQADHILLFLLLHKNTSLFHKSDDEPIHSGLSAE